MSAIAAVLILHFVALFQLCPFVLVSFLCNLAVNFVLCGRRASSLFLIVYMLSFVAAPVFNSLMPANLLCLNHMTFVFLYIIAKYPILKE